MHEKMEHPTPQLVDQRIPFPHDVEGGNVQALHEKAEGQLDWPQTESSTHIRHARRKKRRIREGAVEGHRQKGKILWRT